jgi:hypothetical protein
MRRLRSTPLAAMLCVALVRAAAAEPSPHAVADTSEVGQNARAFVEASRAETLALLIGRYRSAKRWDVVLDETLYRLAPRGAWGPDHPAWKPARAALTLALRKASAERVTGEAGEMLYHVVRDHAPSDPAERAAAVAFYRSPGGQAFLDRREWVLRERTFGLPFVVETQSREEVERRSKATEKTLLELPEAQTSAVYEFTNAPLGERLLQVENDVVADIADNVLRSELDATVLDRLDAIGREVRAAVPAMPPPSSKTYLGTVTMRADRTLDVVVEQYSQLRKDGTYPLSYAPDALHWKDVAAGAPGIAPGQTRFLYVDADGRLSDQP